MPLIANVLHISDTHFSPSLLETGRRLKKLKILPGPKTHAFGKVDALSIKVRQLAREKGKVDLFLITGDVTTDGGPKSMTTALRFLEEDKGVYLGRPPSLKTLGLGAKPLNRIVVPGNHDRYAEPTSGPRGNSRQMRWNKPLVSPGTIPTRSRSANRASPDRL